jgi:hypothetical protein
VQAAPSHSGVKKMLHHPAWFREDLERLFGLWQLALSDRVAERISMGQHPPRDGGVRRRAHFGSKFRPDAAPFMSVAGVLCGHGMADARRRFDWAAARQ